ncbi:MAG: hypothetical protein LIO93_01330 [Bacteroidales bacterium]|nr:hypothetical protein [Bacteroidales bacterium]
MLLLFPQGEIQSMHKEYIKFESGIGYLLKRLSIDYNIIININLVDYNSEKRPQLNAYFKILDGQEYKEFTSLEKTFNMFYTECKTKQVAAK